MKLIFLYIKAIACQQKHLAQCNEVLEDATLLLISRRLVSRLKLLSYIYTS